MSNPSENTNPVTGQDGQILGYLRCDQCHRVTPILFRPCADGSGREDFDPNTLHWTGGISMKAFLPHMLGLLILTVLAVIGTALWWKPDAKGWMVVLVSLTIVWVLFQIWCRYCQITRRYWIHSSTLRVREGVFIRHDSPIHFLYIQDVALLQPFWQRLLGIGSIRVRTSQDATHTELQIYGIPDAARVHDILRSARDSYLSRRGIAGASRSANLGGSREDMSISH